MQKLFVAMVGGYPERAHTEVHDIRFVIGRTIEDTFEALKAQWWGGGRVHLDAWGALEWADGHDVVVSDERPEGAVDAQLWFCHLGGYRDGFFGELHSEAFVVAADKGAAKRKALSLAPEWDSPHRDTVHTVETIIDVADAAGGPKVWLVPSADEKPFAFEAKYYPIRD
ncbi:DUF1543 domain-containing protein [Parvularcula sp. ZS-1/3]|uniref:DUF1543 domain-containing protein n=1 Tax=Parvularcula mediterranea TaxID=2732508 RepID=A0A7Y3W642_9PROT|nr:DUF1543 domain-containing protein [Parvularcula mediterranea]NNU17450.1 DUF1543 domain-containing protein [Parvularcula mediterranea]